VLRVVGYLFFTLVVLAIAAAAGYLYWESLQPQESVYDPIIVNVARHEGVDPFLIRALIWRESHFDPLDHGSADEHGLMQIRPDVGEMWAKANKVEDFNSDKLYDPETNIRVGTWYLNRSLKRYSQTDDPATFALAEYNAGHSNAEKWIDPLQPQSHTAFLDRITFSSTRAYVEVILAKRAEFTRDFANDRWYKADPDAPSAPLVSPTAETNSPASATNTLTPISISP
jgi:soluble lytic murein transglycosylase